MDCTTIGRAGGECASDADCTSPEWCLLGQCGLWTCNKHSDCPDGAHCEDFTCVPDETTPVEPRTNKLLLAGLAAGGIYYYTRGR